MKKPKPGTVRKYIFLTFLAGVALIILSGAVSQSRLAIAGLVIGLASVAIDLIFYRCPHCGAHLNARGWIEYCPYCGEALDEERFK